MRVDGEPASSLLLVSLLGLRVRFFGDAPPPPPLPLPPSASDRRGEARRFGDDPAALAGGDLGDGGEAGLAALLFGSLDALALQPRIMRIYLLLRTRLLPRHVALGGAALGDSALCSSSAESWLGGPPGANFTGGGEASRGDVRLGDALGLAGAGAGTDGGASRVAFLAATASRARISIALIQRLPLLLPLK